MNFFLSPDTLHSKLEEGRKNQQSVINYLKSDPENEEVRDQLDEQILGMDGSKHDNTFRSMSDTIDALSLDSRIVANDSGSKPLQKWMINGNDLLPDNSIDGLKHSNFKSALKLSDESNDHRLSDRQKPKWTVAGQSRSARPARLTELRSSRKRGEKNVLHANLR